MPEKQTVRVPRRASRMTWSLVCTLPLCGIPAAAMAQSIPPGLRACAAEPDSLRRLVCYDKEMARLTKSTPPSAAAPPPPAPPPVAAQAPPADTSAPASSPPPPQASSPPPADSPPPQAAAAPPPPSPPAASTEASAPPKPSLWRSFVGGDASRVTAHVAGLDRSADSMVLHLDNGQVWQQIGPVSGALTLRVGDSVTIEKHLGSFWLSSRYVSDMKVRLQSQ
jgi:hypothetical protein